MTHEEPDRPAGRAVSDGSADGAAAAVPDGPGAGEPRLRMVGVSKRFPGVQALADVSLEVMPGEIHALVGENGAGKSTLMNILAGVYQPDAGKIEIGGERVHIADEAVAGRLGVAMVHQEQSLVAGLSVAENIFGANPPRGRVGIDVRAMRRRAAEVLDRLGYPLPPERIVGELSPAQAQIVEIAKAVNRPLRVLVLDEPTASLTSEEVAKLFRVMRQLASDGVGIIFVSHRLAEVFEIASRVTVLRDGKVTGVRRPSETSVDDLIHLMVGRELSFERDPRRAPPEAPVVLEVRNVVARRVARASLTVRAGEIVCLAGLVGAGRTELCEAIFGVRRIRSGEVCLDGKRLRLRHPGDAVAARIHMLPEDRKSSGVFLNMDIPQNVVTSSLGDFVHRGVISWAEVRTTAQRFVERLSIRTPNLERKLLYLSGGNQQKVLLARWLVESPRLLIVDEPTRGIDVGSKSEIYSLLRGLAEAGTALLVVSSDLPEVLALAHRIVVMAEGRITGELDAAGADEVVIMRLASPRSDANAQEDVA
jgi:ribose transport system ATP-binding protein/rhamnose transport system ATP-binding protein